MLPVTVLSSPELTSRYSHLVYNGSVHYWHAARPLQCEKLRHHLLHSQEKLCQVLDSSTDSTVLIEADEVDSGS